MSSITALAALLRIFHFFNVAVSQLDPSDSRGKVVAPFYSNSTFAAKTGSQKFAKRKQNLPTMTYVVVKLAAVVILVIVVAVAEKNFF